MRHIRQYSLLLLLSFSVLLLKGQKVDSLLKVLNSYKKEDVLKLCLLNSIAREYQYSDIKLGLQYSDSAIVLGKKINDRTNLAIAYMIKGQSLTAYGNPTEALVLIQTALDEFEAFENKRDIAYCLASMGDIYLRLSDPNKALGYYSKSLALSEQVANKKGMAVAYSNSGTAYRALSNRPKALEAYQKAAALSERNGEPIKAAVALSGIGGVYSDMGDYTSAISYIQKSMKVNEQYGVSRYLYNDLTQLGIIYTQIRNFKESLEYHFKALLMARSFGTKDSINNLSNIAANYTELKQYDEAEKYYLRAVKTAEQTGTPGDAVLLNNFGFLYYELSQFSKAWAMFQKGLAIAQKDQNKSAMGLLQLSMGEWCGDAPDSVLIEVGIDPATRYATTLTYLNNGRQLSEEAGHGINQRFAWQDLSLAHERNHEYAKALKAFKRYIFIRDSLVNGQNEKKIAQLIMQYEFDKQSDSLKLQERLTAQKLEKQVLLATQQQQEIQLGKNRLELINKEKDLQHLAFLSTQSSLENEQLEKQGKIKQLALSENEKQLQAARVRSLTQEKTLSELKRQQQFIYLLIGLGLISFIILYLFYKARLQRVHLKNQIASEKMLQEQKESEFQRQLGDISLSALRSQMNPHFIFNCLNSIKLYTAQNNTAAASEYLTKFSKLIRLVLDNSRTDKITLTSELDALRLYMDMEAMRFKEKLRYHIKVDDNVDAGYIEIPPMLLQPYVENAIWHGLMHKEEGGKIDINIGLEQNETILVINITDDGIGREKSALLKSKTATKHKSYGTKVTSERLALINSVYKTGADVTIHDIFDNTGLPSGTRVIIKIPIE